MLVMNEHLFLALTFLVLICNANLKNHLKTHLNEHLLIWNLRNMEC